MLSIVKEGWHLFDAVIATDLCVLVKFVLCNQVFLCFLSLSMAEQPTWTLFKMQLLYNKCNIWTRKLIRCFLCKTR